MKKDFKSHELHVWGTVTHITPYDDGGMVWEIVIKLDDPHPMLGQHIDLDQHAQVTMTRPYVDGCSCYDIHGIANGDRVSVVFKSQNPQGWEPIPVRFYKPF